ncbi:MAG: hypothetical protein MUF45_08645 [Spirosomaceae bacterium]|jgi:hypothetical protein|nr:hypothetical protein [Spirosomataceae bacterium]
MKNSILVVNLLFGLIFASSNCFAQTAPSTLKIFLNCSRTRCYDEYLRTELTFFEFVRDMEQADVQIMIINQPTGSGGRTYQLNFIGQKSFESIRDTLFFSTKQTDTEDITRKLFLQTIRRGLVRYIIDSELFEQITVNYPKKKNQESAVKKDPWNAWVFNNSVNGSANGESNRRNFNLNTSFRINRVTKDNKFSFNSYYNQRINGVKVDSTFNVAKVYDYGFNSIYVKSFSEHWSVGGFYKGFHSLYQNLDFSQSLAPAIEYNIYPISEFTKHQLRWIYQTGVRKLDYIESTVFDKLKETLPYHQLTGIYGVTEPWGSFSAELSGYQYLHDIEKYRMSLELDVSWRVLEGLFLRFYGYASQVKNQISLAKSKGDAAQVLLGGRQLPTTFSYNTSFGISYTFGSINNSVVNPRFSGVD